MGLVVNTNVAALNTARVLRRSTLALNKSLERLSSGLRINRAGDDAAGLAIATGFQSQVRGLRVAQRNAQDGISLVQTAEGALSEMVNILQRIRELAVQAASGTQTTSTRLNLDAEVQQLKAQIDDIATRTTFNTVAPLNTASTIAIQTGSEAGQILNITTVVVTAASIGVGGTIVTGPTAANANTAITSVDAALVTVNTQRSNYGAVQNRLEFTINVLAIQEENSTAAESAIRDADIATETIAFTRNQILVAAGTSILAQANLVPQTALQLLG